LLARRHARCAMCASAVDMPHSHMPPHTAWMQVAPPFYCTSGPSAQRAQRAQPGASGLCHFEL
jgi:hypothetical protein